MFNVVFTRSFFKWAAFEFAFVAAILLQTSFVVGQCFPVGFMVEAEPEPKDFCLADFNSDGRIDLAIVREFSAELDVFLADEDLMFSQATSYSVFPSNEKARAIVAADLNSDSFKDLVVVGSGGFNIFLADGKDGFLQNSFVPKPNSPNGGGIGVADIDGDSVQDLIVSFLSNVKIYRGLGDGTFEEFQTLNDIESARQLLVKDLNGDFVLDLVAVKTFSVDVILSEGNEMFSRPKTYPLTGGLRTAAIGDLNEDGGLDIATAAINDTGFTVLMGDGSGKFFVSCLAGLEETRVVEMADLDNDSDLDVVVVHHDPQNLVSILLNHGDATFELTTMEFDRQIVGLELAHLNEDSFMDMVLTNDEFLKTSYANFYYNNGAGEFSQTIATEFGPLPREMQVVDFDGTGSVDLFVFDGSGLNRFELSNDDVGFEFVNEFDLGIFAHSFELAELDGIPGMDLIVGNLANLGVDVYTNDQNGSFLPSNTIPVGNVVDFVVGDFNADKSIDIALLDISADELKVFLGAGDATFREDFSVGFQQLSSPMVRSGDFNSDSITDLVVYTASTNQIFRFAGNGDGSFSNVGSISVSGAQSIDVVDLNDDNYLDLVVGQGDGVVVVLGDGEFGFGKLESYTIGPVLENWAVGDLNFDNVPDIVVGGRFQNDYQTVVLRGLGDGSFSDNELLLDIASESSFIVTDLNNDSVIDLIAGSNEDDSITIAYGICPVAILLGDINLDGVVDLLDVSPFVQLLMLGQFQLEADLNQDGVVDLLDVDEFVSLLSG